MATTAGFQPGKSKELLQGLPREWQGFKHLSHPPLLFPGGQQEVRSEVEQPGLQPAPIRHAGVTGSSLTHYTTALAPVIFSADGAETTGHPHSKE